eukprot:COSAG01_NODE_13437_length_1585_cov_4.430686_1_plen_90_part_00
MEYEYTFLGSTHMEPPAGSHACGEEAVGEPSLPRALPTAGGATCRRGMGESKGRGAHLELFFAVAKYMSLLCKRPYIRDSHSNPSLRFA